MFTVLCFLVALPQSADNKAEPVPIEEILQLNDDWVKKIHDAWPARNRPAVDNLVSQWRKAAQAYEGRPIRFRGEVMQVTERRTEKGIMISVSAYPEGRKPDGQVRLKPDKILTRLYVVSTRPIVHLYTTDRVWAASLKKGDNVDVEGTAWFTGQSFQPANISVLVNKKK